MLTDRLLLRAFLYDDWQALHAILVDPPVSRYVPFCPPSEQETRETVQILIDGRHADPPRYDFALVLRSDAALIGHCAIMIRPEEYRQGELLYILGTPYWGHGYATEGARAVLGFGFRELDLHRVYATCRPANVASSRVLEKIGMRREGHLRRHRWMKGAWQDSYLYAILEGEWQMANPCASLM